MAACSHRDEIVVIDDEDAERSDMTSFGGHPSNIRPRAFVDDKVVPGNREPQFRDRADARLTSQDERAA